LNLSFALVAQVAKTQRSKEKVRFHFILVVLGILSELGLGALHIGNVPVTVDVMTTHDPLGTRLRRLSPSPKQTCSHCPWLTNERTTKSVDSVIAEAMDVGIDEGDLFAACASPKKVLTASTDLS
jgi:hypothetical protein